MTTKSMAGFTLLELIIALVIAGVLAIVSIGSYRTYVLQSRRIDGVNMLLSISLAEEKYRASNTTYGTLAQVWSGVTTSPEGYYTVTISNLTATTYTLTATAVGNQGNDSANGTSCATLTLAMSNGTITKTPSACWPT